LWLSPTRTFTVLMWRSHERTIPVFTGMTDGKATSSRQIQDPLDWSRGAFSSLRLLHLWRFQFIAALPPRTLPRGFALWCTCLPNDF
jgi:hypothetical protein